jgi:hypothetical protein
LSLASPGQKKRPEFGRIRVSGDFISKEKLFFLVGASSAMGCNPEDANLCSKTHATLTRRSGQFMTKFLIGQKKATKNRGLGESRFFKLFFEEQGET